MNSSNGNSRQIEHNEMESIEPKKTLLTVLHKGELRIIGMVSIDMIETLDDDQFDDANGVNCQTLLKTAKEFGSTTSMHGIPYLVEQGRHWTERVFWIIAFIASVALCTYAIHNIWMKCPVLVTFADQTTSVSMIPFPSTTVCSTQKSVEKKVNVSRLIKALTLKPWNKNGFMNFTSKELNELDALMYICLHWLRRDYVNHSVTRTESIYETIKEMAPNTRPYTNYMKVSGFFHPIFTSEGFCYTFNSLNSRDIYSDEIVPELLTVEGNPNATQWNVEDGYNADINQFDRYPYALYGVGYSNIVHFSMGSAFDDSHRNCHANAQGYLLALHSPDELPRLPSDFIQIPMDKFVHISIKPSMMITSNGLRKYSPETRGCFFKAERQLRFFRSYNQRNCELECISNFTKNECDCVQFWMPRDNQTNLCTILNYECFDRCSELFAKNMIVAECNCLPDCTAITYDVETSQTNKVDLLDNKMDYQTIKVTASYKQPYFMATNRLETYTMAEFIASVGGLLGLFMGVSLLSIIELIYHFSLRLFCTLKQKQSSVAADLAWAKRSAFAAADKRGKLSKF